MGFLARNQSHRIWKECHNKLPLQCQLQGKGQVRRPSLPRPGSPFTFLPTTLGAAFPSQLGFWRCASACSYLFGFGETGEETRTCPLMRIGWIISGEEELPRGHGPRPVWGPVFSQVDRDQDLERVRIDNLARYLRDIQSK